MGCVPVRLWLEDRPWRSERAIPCFAPKTPRSWAQATLAQKLPEEVAHKIAGFIS